MNAITTTATQSKPPKRRRRDGSPRSAADIVKGDDVLKAAMWAYFQAWKRYDPAPTAKAESAAGQVVADIIELFEMKLKTALAEKGLPCLPYYVTLLRGELSFRVSSNTNKSPQPNIDAKSEDESNIHRRAFNVP